MYERSYWQDHVVDQNGNIIQQGTLQDQAHFNNQEEGISDVYIATKLILLRELQNSRTSDEEVHRLTLSNTQSYPFNSTTDTPTTVALTLTRNTKDYTVDAYVEGSEGGETGAVHVTDKLTNGFKVSFDGSATSVAVVLIVRGGM